MTYAWRHMRSNTPSQFTRRGKGRKYILYDNIELVTDITGPYNSVVLCRMMFGTVIAMIVYSLVPENPKL